MTKNERRIERGAAALQRTDGGGEEESDAVDMIADILHYAHKHGWCIDRICKSAQMHLWAEVDDDEECIGLGVPVETEAVTIECACGRTVECGGFTNTCECGRDYNWNGTLLAPREQWGEETGESLADILGPDTGEDW